MAVHDQHLRTVRRERVGASFGPGMVLGLAGTAGVVLSMFLPWRTGDVDASEIPFAMLWDRFAHSGPSLLIALIPIAAVIAIGSLLPGAAAARFVGGVAALVVGGLFAYQLHRNLDASTGLGDVLDIGFYLAVAGGLVALVSGLMPGAFTRRTTYERSDADADADRADVVDDDRARSV